MRSQRKTCRNEAFHVHCVVLRLLSGGSNWINTNILNILNVVIFESVSSWSIIVYYGALCHFSFLLTCAPRSSAVPQFSVEFFSLLFLRANLLGAWNTGTQFKGACCSHCCSYIRAVSPPEHLRLALCILSTLLNIESTLQRPERTFPQHLVTIIKNRPFELCLTKACSFRVSFLTIVLRWMRCFPAEIQSRQSTVHSYSTELHHVCDSTQRIASSPSSHGRPSAIFDLCFAATSGSSRTKRQACQSVSKCDTFHATTKQKCHNRIAAITCATSTHVPRTSRMEVHLLRLSTFVKDKCQNLGVSWREDLVRCRGQTYSKKNNSITTQVFTNTQTARFCSTIAGDFKYLNSASWLALGQMILLQ